MRISAQRSWCVFLSFSLLAFLLAASLGCARTSPRSESSSWPRRGTVEPTPTGGVRATGIIVRYPVEVFSNPGGGVPWTWVLLADAGSLTTPPVVMAALMEGAPTRSVIKEIKAADGRLATIEGTLLGPRGVSGRPQGVSGRWDRLAVGRVRVAPARAQAGLFPDDSLVQPGMWFEEPWRLALALELGRLKDRGGTWHRDPREAQAEVGRPLLVPSPSVAGTAAAVHVGARANTRLREVTLLFGSGLRVVEAAEDIRPVYRRRKLYRRDFYYWGAAEQTTTAEPPDYAFVVERLRDEAKSVPGADTTFELARIRGRLGIWGPDFVQWWDGTSFITVEYGGPPSRAPSREQLLDIARSMAAVR